MEQRAATLLVQHRLVEEAEARAAVLLGDRGAGPAELRELAPGRLGVRREERACLLPELLLQRREGEVH